MARGAHDLLTTWLRKPDSLPGTVQRSIKDADHFLQFCMLPEFVISQLVQQNLVAIMSKIKLIRGRAKEKNQLAIDVESRVEATSREESSESSESSISVSTNVQLESVRQTSSAEESLVDFMYVIDMGFC